MLAKLRYAAMAIISETSWIQRVSFVLLVTLPNFFQSGAAQFFKNKFGIEMPISIPFVWSITISAFVLLLIAIAKMAQKGLALEDALSPKLHIAITADDIAKRDEKHKQVDFRIINDSGLKISGISARVYSVQVGSLLPKVINEPLYPDERDSPFDLRSGDQTKIRFAYAREYTNGTRDIGLDMATKNHDPRISERSKITVRILCNECKYSEHVFEIAPDDKELFFVTDAKSNVW